GRRSRPGPRSGGRHLQRDGDDGTRRDQPVPHRSVHQAVNEDRAPSSLGSPCGGHTMTTRLIVSLSKPLVALAVALSGSLAAAYGATLYVENNGVDGAGCGTIKTNACRSISPATAFAIAGDRIIVGPGRYGDLNRNHTLGETGEETPSSGCGCMLSI